jgi:hypothetical protein
LTRVVASSVIEKQNVLPDKKRQCVLLFFATFASKGRIVERERKMPDKKEK